MKKTKIFHGLIEKLENRAMGKSDQIKKYEFWGLTQRVAKLVGMEHLRDEENPVMPHVLAQALMDALLALFDPAEVQRHALQRGAVESATGAVR